MGAEQERTAADVGLCSGDGAEAHAVALSPLKGPRTDDQKFLETVAGMRCPCGHLAQRHGAPTGVIEGEKWGDCRDCDCRGLIDCMEDADA